MKSGFKVVKREGDDWAWNVFYPDGKLVDTYASKAEAERIRATMNKLNK